MGVYSTPCFENRYTSSKDGFFSIFIFEIIFFFNVSIVSSPYSLSNENSTFMLYVCIFSSSVLLNISLKYSSSLSSSASLGSSTNAFCPSCPSCLSCPYDFIFFSIYDANLSFSTSTVTSQFCFVTGFVLP